MLPMTIEDIGRLLEERIEENTRLEFKRHLPESGKNDDLARDIACMANAEGGMIIFGMEEEDRRAKALAPFRLAGCADRVALIAESIDEPVHLEQVSAIDDGDPGSGYLVVEIARSNRAPHVVRGTVWGRTPKGNAPLTRRQIGELYARQEGFTEEFRLITGKPGRLRFEVTRSQGDVFFSFENDGDNEIQSADWRWLGNPPQGRPAPTPFDNPFPVRSLPAGGRLRVRMMGHVNSTFDGLSIETSWTDHHGKWMTSTWPVTWA